MEHRGQSPTLKLGDACLLVLRSNPAIPTRAVNNHNQLEPRCKQVAEFTSPGGTSLWHYWWPQSGSPKLKDSQDRSGKGPFTVKDKVIMQNKSSHCKGDRLQRKPFHFPSPSIFPIHPDAQSPHPDTSIESSLPPQISHWIHRLAPLPHLPQTNHLTTSTAGTLVSAKRRQNCKREGKLHLDNWRLSLWFWLWRKEGKEWGNKLERWGRTRR